jgi:tRNA-splicing ligase RtcB (3'-phosphate/5'-hydroxy nucleic acid ligase)
MSVQQNAQVEVEDLGHKVFKIELHDHKAESEPEPSNVTESSGTAADDLFKVGTSSLIPDKVYVEEPKTPPSTPAELSPSPSLSTQAILRKEEKATSSSNDDDEIAALLDSKAPFIHRIGPCAYEISPGHVRGQHTPAKFFASLPLLRLVVDELTTGGGGAFTAAVQQLCNVATLPGIIGSSIGMPDIHSGYGFAIGNVAAFDASPGSNGVVSPGGVGFDINCGVRVLRTSLHSSQILGRIRENLALSLEELIPVGIGEAGAMKLTSAELDKVLRYGMEYTEEKGISWPEDRLVCEGHGRFQNADPKKVSERAKKRGRPQAGSLGSGNHYVEVQAVDTIYDVEAAKIMGITRKGQVLVMIHTGSRGLGHQVASDALAVCDEYRAKHHLKLVDRQLAYVPIHSQEGQDYLGAMGAAANFAFMNRSVIAHQVRLAFERTFHKDARTDLDMHMIYDVSHNVAKLEEHENDQGKTISVLVHRKGATRAFPAHHPAVSEKYKTIGQPVLIGGSMGTASYILVGTEAAMKESFGSTCHGAGRALSRNKALKTLLAENIMNALRAKGVVMKVASKHLISEEAPESYKDVDAVAETCENAGISKRVARLVPLAVVKG